MRTRALIVLFASSVLCPGQPTCFFVVHCEPQNATALNFVSLSQMVADADTRNVKLTIHLSPQWAAMIAADAGMSADLSGWQAAGHEVGAHHHGVTAPGVWDGYTDLDPAGPEVAARMESYLGDMDDFKQVVDQVVTGGSTLSASIPTSDYEWPYGVLYRGDGVSAAVDAVSTPWFSIHNNYGVWQAGFGVLSELTHLNTLMTRYGTALSSQSVGVVTHVSNYQSTPGLMLGWWNHLAGVDPSGANNTTLTGLLGGEAAALQPSVPAVPLPGVAVVDLLLRTDATRAGHSYIVAASLSGSEPGFDVGTFDERVHVGLVPDALTWLSLANANTAPFVLFQGTLDASGGAIAQLEFGPLPTSAAGTTVTLAFVAMDAGALTFSSNPATISIN